MPDVSLNGIEFEIKGSSDKASDSIKNLISELGKLKGALDKVGSVKGLTETMKKVESAATSTSKALPEALQNAIKSADKIDILKAKLFQLQEAMNKAFQSGDAQGAFRIRGQILDTQAAIEKLEDQARRPSGLERFKQSIISTHNKIVPFVSALKKIGSAVGKPISAPLKEAASSAFAFAKRIGGVVSGFKRIAGYRILRTVIKLITQAFSEGTKNLYEWSRALGGAVNAQGKTFAQSMDQIATSMLYLKNSIGAAVGPLISALAPAIDFLVDKIVTLLNLINQLIAKLTGASSWNRAKKKATEYGDAVSGAGQAAKEAMLYLAPFDELNVLPDDRDRGSGGGGAAEDYSDMFEEVSEFNEAIANFADSIKEKVNAGDWQGLGELLGGKVNELVEKIDFAGAGAKVGTGINAWFTTKYWTLQTINFQNIGSKIAEFLNNALENIDFEIIGRRLTQKFTIIGDFLIGAIENINWTLFGDSIGDMIRGAFDQLSEWIQGVDWNDFGSTVYNAIKDTVEGLDFGSIAQSMFTLLGSAIRGAVQFSYSFIKEAVDDIWGYLMSFGQDENGDGVVAGQEMWKAVLKGIANGLLDIGKWIDSNIVTPFMNALVGEENWTDFKQSGIDLMNSILTGVKNGWELVKAWFSDNFARGIAQFGIDAANGLVQPIEDGLNAVIDKINEQIQNHPVLADWLGVEELDHIDIKMVPDLDPPVGTFYEETKARIEAESKSKPTGITAKGSVTSVDTSKIGTPSISSKAKFTTFTSGGFPTSGNYDSSHRPIISAKAKFTTFTKGFGKNTSSYDSSGRPIFASRAKFTTMTKAFASGATKANGGTPLINSRANFTSMSKAFASGATKANGGTPLINSRANFTSMSKAFVSGATKANGSTPLINSIANFDSYSNNLANDPSINSTAYFDDWTNGLNSKPSISVDAYVDNVYDNGYKYNAGGGVFSSGQWHDIAGYASGGSPRSSQLFFARENGMPELVGTIGNRTAVLNNGQIVESVAYGVQKAIAGIHFKMTGMSAATPMPSDEGMSEETLYRAMVRALNDSDVFPDTIDLDGDVVYRKMVQRNRRERTRLGVNPMMAT